MKLGLLLLFFAIFFAGSMLEGKKYVFEEAGVQWELETGESSDADDTHISQYWLGNGHAQPNGQLFCLISKSCFNDHTQIAQSVEVEGYFPPPDTFFS